MREREDEGLKIKREGRDGLCTGDFGHIEMHSFIQPQIIKMTV